MTEREGYVGEDDRCVWCEYQGSRLVKGKSRIMVGADDCYQYLEATLDETENSSLLRNYCE